jgi:hypothetical protein
MAMERLITVSYLAKIAGVKEKTVWRNVAELRAILGEEPLEGASLDERVIDTVRARSARSVAKG